MNTWIYALIAIAVTYLIGSIPFGFLLVKWKKGIDLRTVGSGNIGATNASRVLGRPYFFVVFLLDALKGFGPTLGFPLAIRAATGKYPADLPALLALAATLGHNFSLYLRFKGGKGVATSLGSVAALDAIATASAALSFLAALVVSRYVSLSSLFGGVVFVCVHFAVVGKPFSRDHITTNLLFTAMLIMLFVRHRGNLARIRAGTEPKVTTARRRVGDAGRSGKALVAALVGFAAIALGTVLMIAKASNRPRLDRGSYTLEPLSRTSCPHQRSERLAFASSGAKLAATCPRYNRMMIWSVQKDGSLVDPIDVNVGGRVSAIVAAGDRFIVLVRPAMDARHTEPAWWAAIDAHGEPIGNRFPIGYDPDDLVMTRDRKTAFVLLSGRAEGETNRHKPCLLLLDISGSIASPRIVSRLEFTRSLDDPDRLALAPNERDVWVSLHGSNEIARVDASDPLDLKLAERRAIPDRGVPGAIVFDSEANPIVADQANPRIWMYQNQTGRFDPIATEGSIDDLIALGCVYQNDVVATIPRRSELAIVRGARAGSVAPAMLPLAGFANLTKIHPSGLAYSPERRIVAVANLAGGSVHVVALGEKKDEQMK